MKKEMPIKDMHSLTFLFESKSACDNFRIWWEQILQKEFMRLTKEDDYIYKIINQDGIDVDVEKISDPDFVVMIREKQKRYKLDNGKVVKE